MTAAAQRERRLRLLVSERPTKSALARSLEAAPFRTLVAPRGQNEYLDSGGILALISLSKPRKKT